MIITNKSCVWISFEKVTIDSDQILDLDVSIPPRPDHYLLKIPYLIINLIFGYM